MRWACAFVLAAMTAVPLNSSTGLEFKVHEDGKRVDVTIDGQPFTAYIWPETLKT